MAFTKVAPAGIGSTPGDGYRIGDSFLHSTGVEITNINASGIITASSFSGGFSGNIVGTSATFTGNLSVGGVLTYEDVTNVDSVGIITAQKDIHVGAGFSAVGVGKFSGLVSPYADIDDFLDVGSNIQLGNAGVVTATTFKGNGDFVDLDVDGHTNLDNVSIAGVTTASTINSTGNIEIVVDNGEFRCGAGGDFKISHSGSENILRSDFPTVFRNAANNETLAKFTPNGAVELYYNNIKML